MDMDTSVEMKELTFVEEIVFCFIIILNSGSEIAH
jgi:hypothetical protein